MKNLALFSLFLVLFFSCKNDTQKASVKGENSIDTVSTGIPFIDQMTKAIAQDPKNPSLYYARAKKYWQEGMMPEARKDAERAITLDSTNMDFYHLLADAYLDDTLSKPALETLERAVKINPKRIPTLLKLAEFQHILQNHEGSLQTIQRIFEIDKTNADAFYLRGMNLAEMRDTMRAIDNFQSAVEQNPELIDAQIELGNMFASRKNPIAKKYFNNALRIDSTNYAALFNYAWYFHQLGQLQEAENQYKKIIVEHPQEADPILNLGLLYMEKKDYDRAYQQFTVCIKVEPTFANCYFHRGEVNVKKGEKANAMADFKQALIFAPEMKEATDALKKLKN